jgi:hypothetical protein
MCDRDASSREHVPQQCLFPEQKDIPEGEDHRKSLITVPSCPDHNSHKSKDDEYLLYVLVMCHGANKLGQGHFQTKVWRAIRRNPALLNRILSEVSPAKIHDIEGPFETYAVPLDGVRFKSVLEKIGRALFFHHFGEKWLKPVKVVPEFTVMTSGSDREKENTAVATIRACADEMFSPTQAIGENPDAFYYQVHADDRGRGTVIRVSFYGDAKVTMFFLHERHKLRVASVPEEIVFDPKDLIGPPYRPCAKCGKANEGLLSVGGRGYTRRCKDCWNTYDLPLPALEKKVLYLDQFAISDMMKSVNPTERAFKEKRVDPYWIELFRRLDSAAKLQLVVCPTSELHWSESMVTKGEPALRRIYEYFSGDAEFDDCEEIEFTQVEADVRAWLADPASPGPGLALSAATNGKRNDWWSLLTVSMGYQPEQLERLGEYVRADRDELSGQLSKAFTTWQQIKPAFDDQADWEFSTLERTRAPLVASALRRAEISDDQVVPRAREYFKTGRFRNIPWVRLVCLLYAALARRAAGGQTTPPNRGTINDFKMVAYMLPYCDAILLDRYCHAYLREEPLRTELAKHRCRVYSADNRDDLLKYLDEHLNSCPKEQAELVRKVYGEDWTKPYESILGVDEAPGSAPCS